MKKLSMFLAILMVACSNVRSSVSILDNPKCELPCWNGITPGQTTQPEVLKIIEGVDGLDAEKTNVLNGPWQIFNKQVWFYLYTDSPLTRVPTDGAVYFIEDKVAALLLQRNIGRSFGDLIDIVGQPESIVSMPFVDGGTVVLAILPTKGVMFEFYAKSDQLQPDTQIDKVMLFDALRYEELLNAKMFSLGHYDANNTRSIMYQWKGYGSIEELYSRRLP